MCLKRAEVKFPTVVSQVFSLLEYQSYLWRVLIEKIGKTNFVYVTKNGYKEPLLSYLGLKTYFFLRISSDILFILVLLAILIIEFLL